MTRKCARCASAPRSRGLLCDECATLLCGPSPLCAEQISSPDDIGAASGVLVDVFGRAHRFHESVIVGRQPGTGGITVAEPSVSRVHAEVRSSTVVDLGSSNGTLVNGRPVPRAAEIAHGDLIAFGHVAFFFVTPNDDDADDGDDPSTRSLTDRPLGAPTIESFAEEDDVDETFSGLRVAPITLASPAGGGAGVLDLDGRSINLPLVQFELVRILVERMEREPDRDERVRGFIRSSELAASLPWETARPGENHLKQLVRRLRRALARAGLPDIIESRHGFGYRLRLVPSPRR